MRSSSGRAQKSYIAQVLGSRLFTQDRFREIALASTAGLDDSGERTGISRSDLFCLIPASLMT